MTTLNNFFGAAEHTVLLIRQLVYYAGTFLRALFLPEAALAARLLAAENQLAACTLRIHQGKQRRPRFTQAFRFLWALLSNYWDGWTQHVHLNQRHLDGLLKEYIQEYYHVARPHQGLDGGTPLAQEQPPRIDGPSKLISFPVCGGLHHRYKRVAA
jgi:hypothetical protein